ILIRAGMHGPPMVWLQQWDSLGSHCNLTTRRMCSPGRSLATPLHTTLCCMPPRILTKSDRRFAREWGRRSRGAWRGFCHCVVVIGLSQVSSELVERFDLRTLGELKRSKNLPGLIQLLNYGSFVIENCAVLAMGAFRHAQLKMMCLARTR